MARLFSCFVVFPDVISSDIAGIGSLSVLIASRTIAKNASSIPSPFAAEVRKSDIPFDWANSLATSTSTLAGKSLLFPQIMSGVPGGAYFAIDSNHNGRKSKESWAVDE
jgi:hypothetical protein